MVETEPKEEYLEENYLLWDDEIMNSFIDILEHHVDIYGVLDFNANLLR